jgi:hypothetical protein
MSSGIVILSISITSVVLVTAGCAAAARRVMKKDWSAILAGGSAVPSMFLLGLIYWLITMEVDDAPPGMVILGSLSAAAMTAPLTFLVSFFTVWLLARRMRLNGR